MGWKAEVLVRCREWKSSFLDPLRSPNADGQVAMAFKRDGKPAFHICHTELRAPALHEHAKRVYGCVWVQSRKIHNKWNRITKN